MIRTYSLSFLQKALNHALALDPNLTNKMQSLNGKILEIIIKPLNVKFFITFLTNSLKLHSDYNHIADATIISSPVGLIKLSLLPSSKVRSLFNDQVKIVGDVEFGQQVKKLFDELELDWEGHLAYFTGDVVAHQFGSLVRKGFSLKRKMSKIVEQQVSDALHGEWRIFPSTTAITEFFNEIDALVLRVERLEIRIKQLLMRDPHEIN
jgi:ubiquinone biosynthesis protein UbiJ